MVAGGQQDAPGEINKCSYMLTCLASNRSPWKYASYFVGISLRLVMFEGWERALGYWYVQLPLRIPPLAPELPIVLPRSALL